MSLTPLIQRQRIRIDAHRRGTGQPNDFNDRTSDIHIHKEAYRDPNKYIIRISLQFPYNVSVQCENPLNGVPNYIVREIQDVLKNKNTRDQLYHEVFEELQKYQWTWNREDAKGIIKRITKAFGLNFTDDEIESEVGEYFAQMLTDGRNLYQIVLDYDKECLYIGQYYKDWSII